MQCEGRVFERHNQSSDQVLLTVRALISVTDPRNTGLSTLPDVADNRFHVAVLCRKGRAELADVAFGRSDVQVRNSQRADVVDLAWMNEADEGISHDHDVKVGRR